MQHTNRRRIIEGGEKGLHTCSRNSLGWVSCRPASRQLKQQQKRMQCYHALPPNHYMCASKRKNSRNLKPSQRHNMPPRRFLAKPKNKATEQLVMNNNYRTSRLLLRIVHYDMYMNLRPKHRPDTIHIIFVTAWAIPCICGFHGERPCGRNICIFDQRFTLILPNPIWRRLLLKLLNCTVPITKTTFLRSSHGS